MSATLGAVRAFEGARSAGVKRFVHVSSIVGVGALPRRGRGRNWNVDESFPYNLQGLRIPYIQTKRKAEERLLSIAGQGGPDLVIVNLPKVLSPPGEEKERTVTERLFQKPFLPLLPNRFNLVDGRDAAVGILLALERGRSNERYILGGEDVCIRRLADMISGILGKRPRLVPVPKVSLKAIAALSVAMKRMTGHEKMSFYPSLVRMLDFDWTCSSEKACRKLGYCFRPVKKTIEDFLCNTSRARTYKGPFEHFMTTGR